MEYGAVVVASRCQCGKVSTRFGRVVVVKLNCDGTLCVVSSHQAEVSSSYHGRLEQDTRRHAI
jgi:hypothetical protein